MVAGLKMVISVIVELPRALISDQNTSKLENWAVKILLKFDVLLRSETQRLIIYLCVIICRISMKISFEIKIKMNILLFVKCEMKLFWVFKNLTRMLKCCRVRETVTIHSLYIILFSPPKHHFTLSRKFLM